MRNNPYKNKMAPVAASKLKIIGGFIHRKESDNVKKFEMRIKKNPIDIFEVFFFVSDGYTNDKKMTKDKINP